MKIDVEQFQKFIVSDVIANEIADKVTTEKIVKRIIELANTHLTCSNCGGMYHDAVFYRSKVHKARRLRLTVCKDCHRKIYRGLE